MITVVISDKLNPVCLEVYFFCQFVSTFSLYFPALKTKSLDEMLFSCACLKQNMKECLFLLRYQLHIVVRLCVCVCVCEANERKKNGVSCVLDTAERRYCIVPPKKSLNTPHIQGGSNMTGTDLCVNKPHCAAAVRPSESEATTSTLPPARVRTCSFLSGRC